MSDTNPQIEIVSDCLFEKRGPGWLFQLAPNGAISYLSADGRIGWRSLAPAAAIEGSLPRGQLAEWKINGEQTELTLTFRYPRQPLIETMTIHLLTGPIAMTVERVLHNVGPVPLKLHELRMLAVDAGGILFADESPANLRCVYVGNPQTAQQLAGPHDPSAVALPQPARLFGGSEANDSPSIAFCDAQMTRFLLEATLRRDIFTHLWQIRTRDPQRAQPSVLAEYAAIARPNPRQPLLLAADERQRLSSLFYQVKMEPDLKALYGDYLTNQNRTRT